MAKWIFVLSIPRQKVWLIYAKNWIFDFYMPRQKFWVISAKTEWMVYLWPNSKFGFSSYVKTECLAYLCQIRFYLSRLIFFCDIYGKTENLATSVLIMIICQSWTLNSKTHSYSKFNKLYLWIHLYLNTIWDISQNLIIFVIYNFFIIHL